MHEAPYLHIQVVSVVIVHHLGVDPRDQLECHFLPFAAFFFRFGFSVSDPVFSRPTPLQLLLVVGVASSAGTATTTKSTTNSKKS